MISPSSVLMSCALLSIARQLPEYPGTAFIELGQGLLVDGAPQRIAYFVTRDSVETVAEYFYRKWIAEGQITLVDGDFEHGVVVSAFSTIEALQQSVILRSQDRTTVGFSVVRALRFEHLPTLRTDVESLLFAHGVVSGEPTQQSSHHTRLLRSGLAQARRIVVEQLKGWGCKGIRERSVVIESRCPEGELRTLLLEQSPDLTAVLQTVIAENASAEGEPR